MNLYNPREIQHVMMSIPPNTYTKTKEQWRQGQYLCSRFHKLPLWTPYDTTRLPYVSNNSIILVKGVAKRKTLQAVYPNSIVMDPFTSTLPSFSIMLDPHYGMSPAQYKCKYFSHGKHCAYMKTMLLYKQFNLNKQPRPNPRAPPPHLTDNLVDEGGHETPRLSPSAPPIDLLDNVLDEM